MPPDPVVWERYWHISKPVGPTPPSLYPHQGSHRETSRDARPPSQCPSLRYERAALQKLPGGNRLLPWSCPTQCRVSPRVRNINNPLCLREYGLYNSTSSNGIDQTPYDVVLYSSPLFPAGRYCIPLHYFPQVALSLSPSFSSHYCFVRAAVIYMLLFSKHALLFFLAPIFIVLSRLYYVSFQHAFYFHLLSCETYDAQMLEYLGVK